MTTAKQIIIFTLTTFVTSCGSRTDKKDFEHNYLKYWDKYTDQKLIEVDHNLRYKCKDDWAELTNESRMLNGIYATLETNDQALKALFEDIAYHHYKAKRWEAMLRNKLRLRFSPQPLDKDIATYLNEFPEIGKKIFKLNRNKVIDTYINSTLNLPITFNSWVFFINYIFIKDPDLLKKTPSVLLDEFTLAFESSFV